MLHNRLLAAFTALVLIGNCAPPARAQCLDWRTFPLTSVPADNTVINALQVFDDGSGPALYLGRAIFGLPESIPTHLFGYPANFSGVQRWDGVSFSNVGTGLLGRVNALAVFDDGSGPALYAGGLFAIPGATPRNVARWNGTTWSPVGTGTDHEVYALLVHDEGAGPALYAGGSFHVAGGIAADLIARWNGASWSTLAGGIPGAHTFDSLFALATFDDGTGPALVAGGYPLGLPSFGHVAQWKSGSWSALGAGVDGEVVALAAWDDGSGPALYAGGGMNSPGLGIARWNGQTWGQVGAGINRRIRSLAVLDDGTGSRLCCGAWPPGGYSPCGLRFWNGIAWTGFDPPSSDSCIAPGFMFGFNLIATVRSFAVFDDGSGPRLFAGTSPTGLGSPGVTLYRQVGSGWEPVGPTLQGLKGTRVRALHVFDDGSGPELYAGGRFCGADDEPARNIARWDGTRWRMLPNLGLIGEFNCFTTFDPGTGSELFAGGGFAATLRWNGVTASGIGVGSQASDSTFALQGFGPHLYMGGVFTVVGGVASPNIVRWNGTSLSPVGNGSLAGVNGAVNALATYDDGSGLALYAGGSFTSGNGVSMSCIGRWDGTNWTTVGSGTNGLVDALVVFDDGQGPALYAGGIFTIAGGVPAAHVARWNGSSWSALGAGLDSQVLSLGVFDDGSGPALYAGGNFGASGATPTIRIARWNGAIWTGVGGGIAGDVWALQSHDDGTGTGPQLFVGGQFHSAGALPSEHFAAWRGCNGTISRFCFGDGSDGECPCLNQGLSGRGCDNSVGSGGARLNATGTTSPDTIVLHAGGELPNAATLVFQGNTALSAPLSFGDGLRCAGGNIKRLYAASAVNGALSVPGPGQPSVSARSAAQGDPLLPGDVRSYQAWYRDPNLGYCGPPFGSTWNLSNAVRIVW